MLARLGVIAAIGVFVAFQAIVIQLICESSRGSNRRHRTRWITTWILVNIAVITTSSYIFTGTILGWNV